MNVYAEKDPTAAHMGELHRPAARGLKSSMPHALFFGLFFVLISIPAFCWLSGLYPPVIPIPLEARKPAEMPTGPNAWRNLEGWNAYISDNIPFRSQMLAAYLHVYESRLHSFKRAYVKGADGHIFAAATAAPEVQIQQGIAGKDEEITARVHAALLSRQAYWRYHGAYYLAAMPPTKPAVYTECLPDWTTLSPGVSYGDRLRQVCNGSGLNMLFFEDALKAKSKERLVYNKVNDVVHWNGAGLLLAAEDMAQRLHRDVPWFPAELSSGVRVEDRPQPDSIFGDGEVCRLSFVEPGKFEVVSGTIVKTASNPWTPSDIVYNKDKAKGTLLLACDSYFKQSAGPTLPGAAGDIAPLAAGVHTFISMHYTHLDFQRMEEIRKKYAPDIVVESVAERALANMQNFAPPFYQKLAGLSAYALNPENISIKTASGCVANMQSEELTLRATAKNIRLYPALTTTPGKDGVLSVGMYVDSPRPTTAILYWAAEGESFGGNWTFAALPQGLRYANFFMQTKAGGKPLRLMLELRDTKGTYRILPCPSEEQASHARGEQ